MSVLDQTMPVSVSLKQALAWIGTQARESGSPDGVEAAHLCEKLAGSFEPTTTVQVHVPIVQVLCEMAEGLRQHKLEDEHKLLNQIVKQLKGNRPRLITASLGFQISHVGELDDQYEKVRKNFVR